jgi:sialidase-1
MRHCFILLSAATFTIAARSETLPFVPVFTPGELDYPCIRIPSLLLVNDNTLLAFAEVSDCQCCRSQTKCRNWTGDGCEPHTKPVHTNNNRDLCMKTSQDGGRTWGPLRVILRNAGQVSLDSSY